MSKREKGAASVLVIFMMILLVTFGSMALSMGLANSRLGLLSTAWMQDYYAMDAQAETCLFQIDQALNEAERAGQQALLISREPAAFTLAYETEAEQRLTALAGAKGWTVSWQAAERSIRFSVPDTLKTANREQDKYLIVEVAIHTPAYYLTGEGLWTRDADESRFSIRSWREGQEAFDLKDVIEFWDGQIPS